MKISSYITTPGRFSRILALLACCLLGTHAFAETPPDDTPPTPIDTPQLAQLRRPPLDPAT